MAQRAQAAALERRQVPAHAVHLGDRGAAAKERCIHVLLVLQRESLSGRHQQRGAAARNQRDHEVVAGESRHGGADSSGGAQPGRVWHRMGRFDDLDPVARHRIAVACHDDALERTRPVRLERRRHRCRGLAGADDDRPAFRRIRKMPRQAARRLRRVDRGVEHAAQQRDTVDVHRCRHANPFWNAK